MTSPERFQQAHWIVHPDRGRITKKYHVPVGERAIVYDLLTASEDLIRLQKKHLTAWNDRYQHESARVAALTTQLQEANSRAQLEAAEHKKALEKAQYLLTKYKQEAAALRKQVGDVTGTVSQLEQERDRITQDFAEEIKAVTSQTEQLAKEVTQQQELRRKFEVEAEEMKQKVSEAEKASKQKQEKLDQLNAELRKYSEEILPKMEREKKAVALITKELVDFGEDNKGSLQTFIQTNHNQTIHRDRLANMLKALRRALAIGAEAGEAVLNLNDAIDQVLEFQGDVAGIASEESVVAKLSETLASVQIEPVLIDEETPKHTPAS